MSVNSELNIEQFHQLILNASAYMTKIEAFSFKIANASIQSILKCLNIASQILQDQNAPMIKKLYVLRFIKDTMILASLPFYECVLVKIMPWIITVSKISETSIVEKRIEMMGRLLKGSQYDLNADANISKSILQLSEQLIKWMGTTIRDHPYSKIHFQSAFRIVMERVPRIKNMRITDLTFFKPDDPNKYQAYYMERQSGEAEGERIFEYVGQAIEQLQKDKSLPQLQALIETGDQYAISSVIDEIEGILENVKPNNVLNMLTLVDFVHRLFMIGDVQAVNLAKDYLLQKVLLIVQILHVHKGEFKNGEAEIKRIVSMIKSWNSKCQSLLLPVQAFRQAFRVLQREGIEVNDAQQLKMDYRPQIGLTFEINKQKLNQIDCNESGAIKRIRACKYVPVYESVPYSNKQKEREEDIHNQSQSQNYEFLSSNKSNSKHSKVSQNSMYYKKEFLQAFSKFPQQANIVKNTEQVNQIHLQHSNLSDHFQQINNLVELSKKPITASQSSQKPLIMSFKKPEKQAQPQNSPQVVFSDSFTSNQKNSPYKLFDQKDFVDIIQQPSMEVNSQHTIKDSGSNKKSSSQSSSNPFAKGSKPLVEVQKAIINYNDYMLPQKNEESQPQKTHKSSKEGSKIKKEKSSSLSRSNIRPLMKSTSRDQLAVTPVSRISNAKSINILQFNEAQDPVQQRYRPEASAKNMPPPPVEQIKVEKTIMKPKFGFKVEQESIATQTETTLKKEQQISYSLSKSKSLSSIYSKPSQQKTLGVIPDNFMDLLNVKPQKVQVNGFDTKVKQLQKQIERMKQKKEKAARVVMQKNLQIQRLKSEMPLPKEKLQEENQKLRKAIQQPKKQEQPELVYRLFQPFETKATMKHISVTPLRQQIKKQILYSKCRLYKNESVEIGFQAKNKQLSFYFTFLMPIQQCTVKVQENSLILTEEIDMRIYKLIQGKQIKFKSSIKDHRYFNEQFQMASLVVRLQAYKKKAGFIQLSIPYHIYNIIEFNPPKTIQKYAKITDWHYCCQGVLTNPHYLPDFFPKIKCQGAFFTLRACIQQKYVDIRIIINNDKFAIQFQGSDQTFELVVVRCIMSLLQKPSS